VKKGRECITSGPQGDHEGSKQTQQAGVQQKQHDNDKSEEESNEESKENKSKLKSK
jgi:hypothetical protein